MTEGCLNNNDIWRKKTEEFGLTLDNDINLEHLQRIYGIGPTHNTEGYDVTYSYLTQKRRHKKYRINKKWLKRYGTIQKFITLKGCEAIRNKDDIEFKFKGVIMNDTGG